MHGHRAGFARPDTTLTGRLGRPLVAAERSAASEAALRGQHCRVGVGRLPAHTLPVVVRVDGACDQAFSAVAEAFAANFELNKEASLRKHASDHNLKLAEVARHVLTADEIFQALELV